MFEEVPRERRGVARLLPIRRVVFGPFVLGGGMLVAALGGSVAVAAAATVLTASVIGSDDLPDRPGPVTAPSTSRQESVSARKSAAPHRAAPPAASRTSSAPPAAGIATSPGGVAGGGTGGVGVGEPGRTSVIRQSTTPAATSRATSPATAPSTAAGNSPSPSASGPRGNALIHVSGYDQVSSRLVYQFATVQLAAGDDGGDLYLISDPDTFTAPLAPSVTVTSGGSICPPAGSTCTPDQVIRAADSGFFAEVAIDAAGVLRSIIEVGDQVGDQSVTAEYLPDPSSSETPERNRRALPSNSSPAPTASATATP
jgi:hypothetical protein